MAGNINARYWALPALGVASNLFVFLYQGYKVGKARAQYKIEAPAITGNPHFERVFRTHQNTMEVLTVFLPSVVTFSAFVDPKIGGALAFLHAAARFVYGIGYEKEAKKRELGSIVSLLLTPITLGWATYAVAKVVYEDLRR